MKLFLRQTVTLTLFILLTANASFGGTNHPYDLKTKNELQELFFENGEISPSKVEKYRKSIILRQDEIADMVYNYELKKKKKSEKKALKKVKKNKAVNSYDMILEMTRQLETEADPIKRNILALNIRDIDHATKSQVLQVNDVIYFAGQVVRFLFNQYKVPRKVGKEGEASNLLNPETGDFYSQEELKELKDKGFDISLLNPPADNGAVQPIKDISKIDVKKRFWNGQSDLYKDMPVAWPKGNEGKFDKIKKTQSRPKVMFTFKDKNGKKIEMKLKLGMETHSEPTVAALGMAVGLYADVTKHVPRFKIWMGDMSWDKFVVDFSTYFEDEDLEKIVDSHGFDTKKGQHYIIFKDGLLEARFEDLGRLGPFYYNDQKGHRGVRGMMAFNLWVHNHDLKRGENNKLIRRDVDGQKRLFYVQHDQGYSMGNMEREKPTDMLWEIVGKDSKKEIVFKFKSAFYLKEFKHITTSDLKWMVRKIAQLSRKQIKDAVELGKWPNEAPYNYSQLYVEKLISRRNDLVKTFGLEGELLPNGKRIEMLPFTKDIEEDAIAVKDFVPGYNTHFGRELPQRLGGIIKGLGNGVQWGVEAALGEYPGDMDLKPEWFGINKHIVAKINLGSDRSITVNPNPTGEDDLYILREDFFVGGELGAGVDLQVAFQGTVKYIKKISLITTVKSPEHASKHGMLLDPTLPFRVLRKKLPKKHILVNEHYLEGQLKVTAEYGLTSPISFGGSDSEGNANDGGGLGIGVEASVGRVTLKRTIVGSLDGERVRVYDDKSYYTKLRAELYSILLMGIKLKHIELELQHGKQTRAMYEVDLANNPEHVEAVEKALNDYDFSLVRKLGLKKKIDSDFYKSIIKIGIPFASYERKYRRDDMKIRTFDENGEVSTYIHQMEGQLTKTMKWNLLTNGETKIADANLSFEINDKTGEMLDPFIELNLNIMDKNVVLKEMERGYLPMVNGTVGDPNFIRFTPAAHSMFGKFGQLNINVKVKYFEEGLSNLLNVSKTEFYTILARTLNIPLSKLSWYMKREDPKSLIFDKVDYMGRDYWLRPIVKRAERFYRGLKKVKRTGSHTKILKRLTTYFLRAVPKKRYAYNTILLNVINKIVGKKNMYLEGSIMVPELRDLENKLPGRVIPFNSVGNDRLIERERITLDAEEAIDIYNLFR